MTWIEILMRATENMSTDEVRVLLDATLRLLPSDEAERLAASLWVESFRPEFAMLRTLASVA